MKNTLEETYKSALKFLEPLTLKEAYALCVEEALHLVKAEYGTVYLPDDQGDFQSVYTTVPKNAQTAPSKEGFVSKSFTSRQPMILNHDQILSHHEELRGVPIQSLIIIPLVYRDKSFGVITLQSSQERYFTSQKVKVLKLFGSIATLGLYNDRLINDMQKFIRRQDLFISMASHELKTPLTTISAYVELLSREKANLKHPGWVDTLIVEVKRLKKLVEEMLQAEQIKTGKLSFDYAQLDLQTIIKQALIDFQSNHPNYQLMFINNLKKQKSYIMADLDKLVQAINNVLNNAAKYSPKNKEITLKLSQNHKYYRVQIIDNGDGINKKDLPKVFNRYYKGANSPTGLGIGLYLTEYIIRQHKGTIQLKSKEQRGTTVTINLPVHLAHD